MLQARGRARASLVISSYIVLAGLTWPPMIFHIRYVLRRGPYAKPDSFETVVFIQTTRGMVLLVSVQFKTGWMQRLRKPNQTAAPSFSPLVWIDEHSIDV